jgi:PleD family two-component response regulator
VLIQINHYPCAAITLQIVVFLIENKVIFQRSLYKMRVLLVEDDTATARSIELALASEGIVCDVAELGEEGLEIGKIYDYDIIISNCARQK